MVEQSIREVIVRDTQYEHYSVSAEGRVWSKGRKTKNGWVVDVWLKPCQTNNVLVVTIRGIKNKPGGIRAQIHHLVYSAWVEIIDKGSHIDFRDGNSGNLHWSNLVPRKQNTSIEVT